LKADSADAQGLDGSEIDAAETRQQWGYKEIKRAVSKDPSLLGAD
jgi:hypothetical protein